MVWAKKWWNLQRRQLKEQNYCVPELPGHIGHIKSHDTWWRPDRVRSTLTLSVFPSELLSLCPQTMFIGRHVSAILLIYHARHGTYRGSYQFRVFFGGPGGWVCLKFYPIFSDIRYDLGHMDIKCPWCGALHWMNEKLRMRNSVIRQEITQFLVCAVIVATWK